jgi:hypothetical protein
LSTPAFAQDGGPSVDDKETARQLMDLGDSKFANGEYAAALEAYTGADRIMKVTSTGLAVGKTLMNLGRLLEARDKLIAVSRIPPQPDESPVLTQARTEAAELQLTIADRIPQLTVQLVGVPASLVVDVRIDNRKLPAESVSLPRAVDPGSHTVTASARNYHSAKEFVTIEEGTKRTVTIALKPTNEPHRQKGKDDDEPLHISPLVYAGVAVAGAGLIVGAVTGGVSMSEASSVKEQCLDTKCPAAAEEDADRAVTLAHVSTASFVVAGVGAAIAGVGLVLTFAVDQEADTAVVMGPGIVGLRGRF